jgi:hypothetical protein
MIRALLPRNSLFAAPRRDSAGTVEAWQFTVVDPIEQPPDAPDCSKRTTEQRRLARLRCPESRPHDRSIEALSDTGKTVIQAACGGLSLLARRRNGGCGHSDARYNEINLALNGPE